MALGPLSPLLASDVKELCIHGSCGTASCGGDDGLCYGIGKVCCIVDHYHFPPGNKTYCCMVCNKGMSAQRESGPISKTDKDLFDMDALMKDTFWLYYILCAGCGVDKNFAMNIKSEFKMLICGGTQGCVAPIEDGICCSAVETTCCIYSEFQLPPAPGNPKIGCCGWKMNKEKAVAAEKKPSMPPTTTKTKAPAADTE